MRCEGDHPAMTARCREKWVDCYERGRTTDILATRGGGFVGIRRCTGMIVMLIGRAILMGVMDSRGVRHVTYLGSVMVMTRRGTRQCCERLPR